MFLKINHLFYGFLIIGSEAKETVKVLALIPLNPPFSKGEAKSRMLSQPLKPHFLEKHSFVKSRIHEKYKLMMDIISTQ